MANIFVKIGGKVWDILSYPFVHAAQIAHMLSSAEKDVPGLKDAIAGLVERGEKVDAEALAVWGTKGLSLPDDLAALADVKDFFSYFKDTFCPSIEQLYKDFTSQSSDSSAATDTPAPATTSASVHTETSKLAPA